MPDTLIWHWRHALPGNQVFGNDVIESVAIFDLEATVLLADEHPPAV